VTRGGARSGAGRRSVLSREQALWVGEECERLWIKASEDQAMARYEKGPITEMIRDEQARTDLIPIFARKARGSVRDITESIDEITGGVRVMSIPRKRAYGAKSEVIKAAIAWCLDEYGQIITSSKAVECWKISVFKSGLKISVL
jgi:hypothetical protein